MNRPRSVAEAVEQHMGLHAPTQSLYLLLDRCRVELLTNCPPLASRLRGYLREFLCEPGPVDIEILALEAPIPPPPAGLVPRPPDPGKSRIKEESLDLPDGRLVRKRVTGMLFYFGEGRNLAYGPCLENDNQVVNFINSRYIQWLMRRGCLLCHAGGIARKGKGVLIAGASGAGKSTLALHMLGKGFEYVSNDRVLIRRGDDGVSMFGVPKLPRVNPGTLLTTPGLSTLLAPAERARYSALPAPELRALEHKHDVDIGTLFGSGLFTLSAGLEAVLLLTWLVSAGPTRLEPVDLGARPDLLQNLIKPAGLFFEPDPAEPAPDFSPRRYIECLQGVPVLECSGGVDFAAAARALESNPWEVNARGTGGRGFV